MSLIPVFEIGLWNAWIFVIIDALTIPVFIRIAKSRKTPEPENAMAGMSNIEKIVLVFTKVVFLPILIYSFFVPLKLGTIWFYIGLPITLIGLLTGIMVLVNWANTPSDKPVTRGLYRFSRHPMYITNFILYFGLGIACGSWIFLLFAVVYTIVAFAYAKAEEQLTLEVFGEAYREYLNSTPRYIGIPNL